MERSEINQIRKHKVGNCQSMVAIENDNRCRQANDPLGYQFHLGHSVIKKGNQFGRVKAMHKVHKGKGVSRVQ